MCFEKSHYQQCTPDIDFRKGLTQEKADEVLKLNGLNKIPGPPPAIFKKLIKYAFGGFGLLLWLAAILSFVSWKPLGGDNPDPSSLALGVLILFIVFLQIAFNFYQDYVAKKTINTSMKMISDIVEVKRDGKLRFLDAERLVKDDIVCLNYGKKVPADMIVIESNDLKVENSILTGESEPIEIEQYTDDINEKTMAYMGTMVVNGSGMGLVINTGEKTKLGLINKLTNESHESKTILQKEIDSFVMKIAILSISFSLFLLIIWAVWLRVKFPTYINLTTMLINCIGVLVAFTPDGLPFAITLTLVFSIKVMRKENILIKNLTAVETLGSVNIVGTDKTGTLTTNIMTVSTLFTLHPAQKFEIGYLKTDDSFCMAMEMLSMCNGASEVEGSFVGDATDKAVYRFISETMNLYNDKHYNKLYEIPFNSRNKFMICGYESMQETKIFNLYDSFFVIKGGFDLLLNKIAYYIDEQGVMKVITSQIVEKLNEAHKNYSLKGERMLLIAYGKIPSDFDLESAKNANEKFLETELIYVGFIGISDPPKPKIKDDIIAIRNSGVRIFMITGDNPLTASAIAYQTGVLTNKEYHCIEDVKRSPEADISIAVEKQINYSVIITGLEMTSLTQEQWDKVLSYKEIVFARTTPDQKHQIVEQLQKQGNIVGMIGDGVNDAPAMKKADIGIAMGNGSDVALNAADMVLLKSDFKCLLTAIENGRLVFNNLKKVVLYLIPAGSFSEIIPIFVNVFLGAPLPLSAFYMVVICILTDLISSLSLSKEPSEGYLLEVPPRNPKKEKLVDCKLLAQAYLFLGIVETLLSHMMFFEYLKYKANIYPKDILLAFSKWDEGYMGYSKSQLDEFVYYGQSIFFINLVIMQAFGNLLSTRTRVKSIFSNNPFYGKRKNLYLILGMFGSISIAVIVVYVPFFNNLFNTRPISIQYWAISICCAGVLLILEETRKFLVQRYKGGLIAKAAW